MLIQLQCGKCKFELDWELPEEEDTVGKFICTQYPEGIPKYVEDVQKDCPKFEEKK